MSVEPLAGTLLLADDDESVAATLSAILEQDGYRVQVERTAAEAVAVLARQQFELVIADLNIEEANAGLEVLEAARRHDEDSAMILLTGYVSTESAVAALRLGASNYLAKPCDLQELRASITRGIADRRRLKELRRRALEAEQERDLTRSILDNVPSAITILEGEDHRVTMINRSAVAAAGVPEEAFLGKPIRDFVPQTYDQVLPVLQRVLATGVSETVRDLRAELPDGRVMHTLATYARLPRGEGQPPAILAINLDITSLRTS